MKEVFVIKKISSDRTRNTALYLNTAFKLSLSEAEFFETYSEAKQFLDDDFKNSPDFFQIEKYFVR